MSVILHGDCIEQLRTLPANSVHMVVTSPPYWSLRDYGVPPTIWGGNPHCAHVWESAGSREGYTGKGKWQHSMTNTPSSNGRGEPTTGKKRARLRADHPEGWSQIGQGEFCTAPGCGAWRGCLGLEPTIELYVTHLVAVFEEVRRVLRKDGTLWLNIGDCYNTRSGSTANIGLNQRTGRAVGQRKQEAARPRLRDAAGLKMKDLCLIPARVALALQAVGWYVRCDTVWSKTNPMPESTRDRPTKSHEYMFLLAKSAKYFYDGEAIREGVTGNSHHRGGGTGPKARVINKNINVRHRSRQNPSFSAAVTGLVSSRNRRSVWTIPTSPYKGAHFATFPKRLVEPCILAGSSAHGCCSHCGAPFRRLVKLGKPLTAQRQACGAERDGKYRGKATKDFASAGAQDASAVKSRVLEGMRERLTVGWAPTCTHTLAAVAPCVVLDPFGGTGTTGVVAAKHGRDFILIELGAHNIALTHERLALPTRQDVPA